MISTHKNIFEKKGNESLKEKERFEEEEKSEEMEKEERLERVSRRKETCLTNKLHKDIIIDIVNGMETAIAPSMMEKAVGGGCDQG